MAKQIDGYLKLQVRGGQANPAPPVGPALGSKGVNIMEFCNQFNARTDDRKGQVLPVVSHFTDQFFDYKQWRFSVIEDGRVEISYIKVLT